MKSITRRAFLQTLGIGLASSAAPWGVLRALEAAAATPTTALWCRVLEAAPVRGAAGEVTRWLFPDEVLPVTDAGGSWYAVSGGRVQRASVQPIACGSNAWAPFPQVGDVVQVTSPYAVVRAWCAADAPQKARIGWGGTAVVADHLLDSDECWLGLRFSDMGALMWSPALAWSTVEPIMAAGSASLRIDRRTSQLVLLKADRVLWMAPVELPLDLVAGRYALLGRTPVARAAEPGAPWELDFGAWHLHGAYWHNQFGNERYASAPGIIEAPVLVARALYAQALTSAEII
ncbi:MAG TPA: hypothetical protein VER79_11235 [Candidatus Limnocylindrales bacterium]|nr:hypothetical protein [Candidatus Limnocylindrales bacterium]